MSELPLFFLRGHLVASLPADDAYRDGLLETMRFQFGRLPLWPLHRARLLRSGELSEPELKDIEAFLLKAVEIYPGIRARARLRWGIINGEPQWDLSLLPLGPSPELKRGVRLYLCNTRLPVSQTANLGCKRLARTGYNRAKAELPAGEPCDGLLLDSEDRVIETLRCNLLAWLEGTWVTPDLRRCGVHGVMRSWLGTRIPLREADLNLEHLCTAREVVLCNSVRGIVPVRELVGYRSWSSGTDCEVETRRLQRLIAEELW